MSVLRNSGCFTYDNARMVVPVRSSRYEEDDYEDVNYRSALMLKNPDVKFFCFRPRPHRIGRRSYQTISLHYTNGDEKYTLPQRPGEGEMFAVPIILPSPSPVGMKRMIESALETRNAARERTDLAHTALETTLGRLSLIHI